MQQVATQQKQTHAKSISSFKSENIIKNIIYVRLWQITATHTGGIVNLVLTAEHRALQKETDRLMLEAQGTSMAEDSGLSQTPRASSLE